MDNNFITKLNELLENIYNSTNFSNLDVDSEINTLHNKFNKTVLPLLKNYKSELN